MPSQQGKATKFSLMTFNIAHGRGLSFYQGFHSSSSIRKNLDKIAGIIVDHQPDVVAFQEIDRSSHWNQHIDLLEHIQEETGYAFSEHGVHNMREGKKPLSYGNAFLSRHPILNCHSTPFGSKKIGEKGFMEARILINDIPVDFINLHLDFQSRRTRIAQIEPILERIKTMTVHETNGVPPIICGDFNAGSKAFSDAVRQFLIRSASHVHYTYYPQNQRTFPSHFPSRGLDFVLVAKPYHASHARAIRCFASDHLPVYIDLHLSLQGN